MWAFSLSIIGIVAGIVLLDLGLQGVHVSNQTRIYALLPEARNRMNTVFMTASFLGTSIGSGVGLWVWSFGGWTGACIAGLIITGIAVVIYALTYSRAGRSKSRAAGLNGNSGTFLHKLFIISLYASVPCAQHMPYPAQNPDIHIS